MNTLKECIGRVRNVFLRHDDPGSHADDPVSAEQTEPEESTDLLLNPLQGVNVLRHPVGRRPRRA